MKSIQTLVVALVILAFSGLGFAAAEPATPATPASPALEKKAEAAPGAVAPSPPIGN